MTIEEKFPDAILLPPLCVQHTSRIVHQELGLKRSDPWQIALLTTQLLLFEQYMRTQDFATQDELRERLRSLGCLACLDALMFTRAMKVMKKGLDHAVAVVRMERTDTDLMGD